MFAGPSLADRERHLENKDGFRASCQSNIKRTQGSDRTVRLKFLITIKFANCLLLHEFWSYQKQYQTREEQFHSGLTHIPHSNRQTKKKNKQKQAEPIFFTRFLESAWRSDKTVPLLINCRPRAFHLHSIKMGQGHEQP